MTDQRRPVLALDIGGTKLAVAVVTEDGATHGLVVEPTRRDDGPDSIIRRLFAMGREAIVAGGLGPVSAVGISCGGPLNAATGVLESPLHLPGWVDVPIVALAEQEFGIPAVLENDATAAALGEFRYGAGVGISTLLYLTISTGIGGGAVIDGRLHRGAAGNGGEYGHIMVRPGGRACLCGRRGCLEAYASGSSIAARAADVLASSAAPASTLRALRVVQARDVAAAAAAGDALARALWDETTQLLSVAITDLVNIVEPDLVVLGGGVTRAGDALLQPIKTRVLNEAMRPAASVVRIELAGLGDVVCAVGAAALAFDLIDARSAPKSAPHSGSSTQTEESTHV
ncbi:MAG TPA: ROK family protein [Humibacter sp.]|nr:ROK family protein [Humibacter sp.]